MKLCRCGNAIPNRYGLCVDCQVRQKAKRIDTRTAVELGYCHAGNEITPVPEATLEKVRKWREEQKQR